MSALRLSTTTLFALAALAFFLPFATVSCSDAETVTVTGAELVTYRVPGASRRDGEWNFAAKVEQRGALFAIVAFMLAVGGAVAAAVRPRRAKLQVLLAIGGPLVLFAGVLDALTSFADVQLRVGFVLSVTCSLAVVPVRILAAVARRSAPPLAAG